MSHIPIIEWSPESCVFVNSSGAIQSAPTVAEAMSALGRPKRITVALGRRQVFTKVIRLPDIAAEEAKALLRFRLEEFFPLPAHELAYDVLFTDDVNSEGRLANVFAAKSETLRQAKDEFKRAGATIERAIPANLGAISAIGNDSEAAVVSPAAEGVAVDVIQNGLVLSSRVSALDVDGTELQAEVARALAATDLRAPIRAFSTLTELLPGHETFDLHPLAALATHPLNVNLRLPEDLAREANQKLLGRRRLATLLIAACVCVGAISYMDRDDAARRVRAEEQKTARMTKELNARQSLVATQRDQIDSVSTIVVDGLDPRQALSDVVLIAANSTPDQLWLTGLTLERGKDLNVRGTARSNAAVSAYSDALSASNRLRDVSLVFSNNNTIGETPVVQFSITAHVIGNLPLVEPKKERSTRR